MKLSSLWPYLIMGVGVITLFFRQRSQARGNRGRSEIEELVRWIRDAIEGLGSEGEGAAVGVPHKEPDPGKWMPALISLIVLGSALDVILSNTYDDSHQKWASGAIGMILGFWLKR